MGGNADEGYVRVRSATPGAALLRHASGRPTAHSECEPIMSSLTVSTSSAAAAMRIEAYELSPCDNPQLYLSRQRRGWYSVQLSEWITIEGNRCYRNAATNDYPDQRHICFRESLH